MKKRLTKRQATIGAVGLGLTIMTIASAGKADSLSPPPDCQLINPASCTFMVRPAIEPPQEPLVPLAPPTTAPAVVMATTVVPSASTPRAVPHTPKFQLPTTA